MSFLPSFLLPYSFIKARNNNGREMWLWEGEKGRKKRKNEWCFFLQKNARSPCLTSSFMLVMLLWDGGWKCFENRESSNEKKNKENPSKPKPVGGRLIDKIGPKNSNHSNKVRIVHPSIDRPPYNTTQHNTTRHNWACLATRERRTRKIENPRYAV